MRIKEEKIKVIVLNEPSKEQAAEKTKELSKFLENTWFIPLKPSST